MFGEAIMNWLILDRDVRWSGVGGGKAGYVKGMTFYNARETIKYLQLVTRYSSGCHKRYLLFTHHQRKKISLIRNTPPMCVVSMKCNIDDWAREGVDRRGDMAVRSKQSEFQHAGVCLLVRQNRVMIAGARNM